MKITRNAAASRWGEAFPLGNGHMGAMVYGGAEKERIDLSELTFFSGSKSDCNNQSKAPDAFAKMRREAAAEDFDPMAETALGVIGVRNNYGTNLPVGSLLIQNYHQAARDYHRSLDLTAGTANVQYKDGEEAVSGTCYTSHSMRVLVYKIQMKDGGLCTDITFTSPFLQEPVWYQDNAGTFICRALETMHSDGTEGTFLAGAFHIHTDGKMKADTGGIHIEESSEILLYLAMETDFDKVSQSAEELQAVVTDRLIKAETMGYEAITEDHKKDMTSLFMRNTLQMEATGEKEVDLIPQMYQMGRYLLYSSSRADSPLPTHLQGIWNDNVACRIGWTCDMHLDINTQMNYWPAQVTNLSETTAPLFHWIRKKLVPNGRETAKQTYGYSGWVAELVSNAWGYAAPYWAEPIAPCPTGGVWILTHMWEHYLFTHDDTFLRDEAFPAIEEAVDFFESYIFKDESGHYIGGPSISPENSFIKAGKIYHNSNGCTYEILMIRELFDIYLKACEVLGTDEGAKRGIRKKMEALLPYRILEDGTIAEWAHNYPATDSQHRHTSHLLGVFPFAQITPDQKELAAAVETTIEKKLLPEENWEDTGWARSMLMLYEARLLHPAKTHKHISEMLNKLLEPNGMIIHPPTRGAGSFDNVYELDGNTGLTSCITEMLMQSHRDYLHILPCLPEEWKSGKISGLKARGNLTVSITWGNKEVETELLTEWTGVCRLRYGDLIEEYPVKAGEVTRVVF